MLINALVADKLLNKDDYQLKVEKGMISINGIKLSDAVNQQYKSFTEIFGNSIIELNSSKK